MERTKHGLFVFPPKKTLIWRRLCSLDQSCCSMTSKQFLESSSGMKFVYPSVRLANQNPGAFVSVFIHQFPFVCCFCFVRAFSFQGHTKIALSVRHLFHRPMKRSKHGLFVFPPKKSLVWRSHCSIGQSCCSMTSKQRIH